MLLPVTRYKRKKTSKAHSDSVARSGKVEDAGAEADGRRRDGQPIPTDERSAGAGWPSLC